MALNLNNALNDGIDKDGGMFYEFDADANHLVREKHWWSKADVIVGFFNAYQLTNNTEYLLKSLQSWSFTLSTLKDHQHGEWCWALYPDGTLMKDPKAGF